MQIEKKVLIVTADKFEDSELLCPMNRLLEAGYTVDIAAPKKGKVEGKHDYEVEANLSVGEIESAGSCGYKLLLLPGGKAPKKLREMPEVLDIVRDFAGSGAPIAAICHGAQSLISAQLVKGRKMTAYKSVQEELADAGADVVDEEVVVDGQYITSRNPHDIPAFNREIMKMLGE
jgi:protease I